MFRTHLDRLIAYSRDGVGNMSIPYPDFVSGTTINSSQVDDNNTHITAALTASVAADGQTPRTANHQMNGFRHTSVGNSSARNMYAATGQVQDGSFVWGGTAAGTADALTLTLVPSITAYAAGQTFRFISSANANTGAATININSVGAKTLQLDGAALVAGDIAASKIYEIVYDGTNFQIMRIRTTSTPDASETVKGIVELATDAETQTGTDTARAVTPANLAAANFIRSDTTKTLTVGYTVTPEAAGTKTTGTFTPDPADGNFQTATNGGAHTLAPPSSDCTIIIQYTNNGSAGAITTSGFTKVQGAFTTVNGDDFFAYITKVGTFSFLSIVALQ